MEDMEYTWLMFWIRTVSSEESVGAEGEPAACLRNSSHFSFMVSRSSFSLFSSAVFFCRAACGNSWLQYLHQGVLINVNWLFALRQVPRVRWYAADSAPGRLSPAVCGVAWSDVLHGPPGACGSCVFLRCNGCTLTPRVPLFTRRK